MNAARRWVLSAAVAASVATPAFAQVELPPPPAQPSELDLRAPSERAAERIRVAGDPRIELMSLLVSRTRMGKRQQDEVAIAYQATATTAFKNLDSHAAVKLLDELQAMGFEGIHPFRFALLLTSPSMALESPLPPDMAARGEQLQALAKAIQAFAAESRFMDFYASQQALHGGIAKKVGSLLAVDDVAGRMEEFYGTSWDAYTVVPAPLLRSVSYGIPFTRPDGTREVMIVVGPLGATAQQEPDFFQPQGLFLAIENAIGQVVVPALTAKFARDVAESQDLYKPLSERLSARGVAAWPQALDEHVLRAVGARMLQARGKVRETQNQLHHHERQGFWYVRKYFDLLAAYQADRKTYPTLESFYPRMLATMSFWKDAGDHQRIESTAKRFMGPIAAATEELYLRRTVLIRPEPRDPAQRAQADAYVKALVARYRDKYGVSLPVMTSFQASAADPAQAAFLIVGTPDSNLYLKALLKYLPIKVSKGDLHLGARQFLGTDLRLVTAFPNPYNPALPFRIVTGSTDEAVFSELIVPRAYTDFVIHKDGKLFQQGDFAYDEKGAWRVP